MVEGRIKEDFGDYVGKQVELHDFNGTDNELNDNVPASAPASKQPDPMNP